VVGRTGAGKTSFLKLFWRGLDTCDGFIKIDGKDINQLDLKELRTEMDVISQESALFLVRCVKTWTLSLTGRMMSF